AGALAFINSSGKFSPEIRQKILGTANSLYGNLNTTYRERAMAYQPIVERTFGQGAFDDVIPGQTVNALEWVGSPGGQGAPLPPQTGAGSQMQSNAGPAP